MSAEMNPMALLAEQFNRMEAENSHFREELDRVKAQFAAEDYGWSLIRGQVPEDTGIELDTLKDVSRRLREEVAGSPLPKQANAVRYSYTFSQPFLIPGLDSTVEPPQGRGRPSPEYSSQKKLRTFYNSPTAQRYVFGKAAQELISTACSTDSTYIVLGDDNTKELHPIPLHQIEGVYTDPDFPDEVWAYRRQWSRPASDGKIETVNRWYYTDTFTGTRQNTLPGGTDGKPVKVDTGKTILAFSTNNQVGWIWGLPDLMAGQVWNKKYIDLVYDGEKMSRALALLAGQVKAKSATGADRMGVQFSNGQSGSFATTGEGNDVGMFSTAGKAYEFRALQPVAELYASSVGIAATDLLASPAASGSSYGAAQAPGPGVRRAIEARRHQLAAWMERIVKWATGTVTQITPANIQDVEPHRQAEILDRMWHTGLFHEDEVRGEAAYLAGITLRHRTAPTGVLLPNNEKSLPRADIDTDSVGGDNPDPTTDSNRAKSDSDKSTDSNDQRTDVISNS